MNVGEMCTCHSSHTHSPHTSRDAPCGVCLGVWRVVFWPSWCLVHHTAMRPLKRARRGEWAYACWRDVHVPHVARTLTTHESRCTLWSMACCFLAKLVLGPPHYHDTFQTCQTWRVGVCMLARCARATRRTHTHHTRVEMHLVEYGVLFLAKLVLGPPHYHDTFETCQTWRVGVCMLARCAR